ncbi:hypothetical protein ABT324_31735 [Saccharopolyspora sp. NPDC000359]|uniref:hypothetical protein n=1 Tax=Saccharopolyspora sp. NPDC000359 TaxID=3154251 RepID=UPI003318D94D
MDVLRLVVAPVVVGQGRRLLTGSTDVGLRLTDHHVTPRGLAVLEYEVSGPAPLASYEGATAHL